ncbi:hypothetical protein [Rhizobium sp. C4]|uniref:hypothetical protein n=1 Tax=Rhizobium sp. C4 TaxID=1349800 RepID=UPI001E59A80D|nr:hypothetical protein [Rhizobium sp. C4]MCD2172603.1 hypothetical protein [Rhizobium sp. C4]
MKRLIEILLTAGVFCGAAVASAHAADDLALRPTHSDIVRANNQVSLNVSGSYLDYLESSGSTPLDSERGWQPGLSLSGSVMTDIGLSNLYLYGNLSWSKGNSDYVGSFIGGNYGDVRQRDNAEIYNEDFRIGKGFEVNDALMLTPYLGLGARQWRRDITGAGGYREDYSHGYVGGGLLAQYSPAPGWVLGVNGLVGSTFSASMKTTATAGGAAITPQTYKLGNSAIYMVGASVDRAITDTVHANISVDYTNFNYGRSAVSPIDSTFEPDSRTSTVALKVGLGFAF